MCVSIIFIELRKFFFSYTIAAFNEQGRAHALRRARITGVYIYIYTWFLARGERARGELAFFLEFRLVVCVCVFFFSLYTCTLDNHRNFYDFFFRTKILLKNTKLFHNKVGMRSIRIAFYLFRRFSPRASSFDLRSWIESRSRKVGLTDGALARSCIHIYIYMCVSLLAHKISGAEAMECQCLLGHRRGDFGEYSMYVYVSSENLRLYERPIDIGEDKQWARAWCAPAGKSRLGVIADGSKSTVCTWILRTLQRRPVSAIACYWRLSADW